ALLVRVGDLLLDLLRLVAELLASLEVLLRPTHQPLDERLEGGGALRIVVVRGHRRAARLERVPEVPGDLLAVAGAGLEDPEAAHAQLLLRVLRDGARLRAVRGHVAEDVLADLGQPLGARERPDGHAAPLRAHRRGWALRARDGAQARARAFADPLRDRARARARPT